MSANASRKNKVEFVRQIKAKGYRVAVVGDGVNDAPALAAGDLGIAMGAAGSEVAIHSATIALMNNDLRRLPFLIKLSRQTRAVINQISSSASFSSSAASCSPLWAASIPSSPRFCTSPVRSSSSSTAPRLVRSGEELDPHVAPAPPAPGKPRPPRARPWLPSPRNPCPRSSTHPRRRLRPPPAATSGAKGEPIVTVRGLTKIFKDFWGRPRARAVDNVDFEVRRGEVFGLLGPNGSGKSTTVKMLLGLLYPTRGHIEVFGHSPRHVKTKALIGYLPEESYLYRFLDSRETLDFFGNLFDIAPKERASRNEQLLEMVGLNQVRTRVVGEFSKGMQRRIGLAQALINDPELVILDEPTAASIPSAAAKSRTSSSPSPAAARPSFSAAICSPTSRTFATAW